MTNLSNPYEVLQAIREARDREDQKEVERLERIYNKMIGRV